MTSIDVYVNAESDDAVEDRDGNVSVRVTTTGSVYSIVGMRFTPVNIPQGAIINDALLSVYCNSIINDNPRLLISGEATDNAYTFEDSAYNISSRYLTSEQITWSEDNIYLYGYVTSPDIKAVIQEIVNRPNWSSGNAINIILIGMERNNLGFDLYDVHAPFLSIVFTLGYPSNRSMYYARKRRTIKG